MASQAYKAVNIHDNEISGWTILSRLLHAHALLLVGMDGDVQSYIDTMVFKNGEQREDFISELSDFNKKITSL